MRGLLILVVVLLAGCTGVQSSAGPTGSPSVAPPSSGPSSPSTAPSPTPSTAPSPSASPVALRRNSVAKVVPAKLDVRPSANPKAEVIDSLVDGDLVYVVDGPKTIAGHPWYDVAAFDLEKPDGWVDQLLPDGSGALAPSAPGCPNAADSYDVIQSLAWVAQPIGLACFGAQPIAFDARLAAHEATCGVSPGWTTKPGWLGPCEPHDYITALTGKTMDTSFDAILAPGVSTKKLKYGIDPKDWLKVRVVGQFDYPAARTCKGVKQDADPPSPAEVVLGCREKFVITSIKAAP